MAAGFNLVEEKEQVSVTIDTLTAEMIGDLIICYAAKIEPSDVESRYRLKERTGIVPTYPIIPRDVVEMFYTQIDTVRNTIIDVVIGKFHIGNVPADITIETGTWVWGVAPTTVQELKDSLFYIISRDFSEQGTWIYDFVQGNFEVLRPFLNNVVDLSIHYTAESNFENFAILIKNKYPFSHE